MSRKSLFEIPNRFNNKTLVAEIVSGGFLIATKVGDRIELLQYILRLIGCKHLFI